MSYLENTLRALQRELAEAEKYATDKVELVKEEIEKVTALITKAQSSRTVEEIEAATGPAGYAVSELAGLEKELASAKSTGTGDVKAIEAEIEKAKAALAAKAEPKAVPEAEAPAAADKSVATSKATK